jgi:L-asparaginase
MTQEKILIINTGGTFNKVYNELTGTLEVPNNNIAIETLLNRSFKTNKQYELIGMIYKDSLEFTSSDRDLLKKQILDSNYSKVIIIHGTDTIDISAEFLDSFDELKDRTVVFTGAMKPFSIETTEATANFCLAYGFLQSDVKSGVYIAMHGVVAEYKELKKNRRLGVFE